jgi:hypothetical protein
MTTAPHSRHKAFRCGTKLPIRTIRDLREALPEQQRQFFDQELAEAKLEEIPEVIHSWATLGLDGFDEFMLSKPFLGLEFGQRSYDDEYEEPGE